MRDNVFKVLRTNSRIDGTVISQKQLEKILNIGHICELESGKRQPSFSQLKAYHSYFNVSYDFLLNNLMPDDDKNMKEIAPDIEVPEWLQDTNSPDEQSMAQLLHELTETGKGMVLLSYLADLVYSDQSVDVKHHEMEEDEKLQKYSTMELEKKIHNFKHVIREYRRIGDSARYGEAKIRIANVIEEASD